MANGHGGKRPGAGRPRKELSQKILEGNRGKRKLKALEFTGEKYSDVPPNLDPPEYLRHFNVTGVSNSVPGIEVIYKETADWLSKTGCLHLINPAFITHYALLITRWMECEDIVSRAIMLKDHNDDFAPNPMSSQALQYKKAADAAWEKIWSVVAQNCEHDLGGDNPNTKIMEGLIRLNFDND